MAYVVVSLDLEGNVKQKDRDVFYEYLEKFSTTKFVKLPNVTTTWYAEVGNRPLNEVKAVVENILRGAATGSGISHYDAFIHLGPEKPLEIKGKP